MLSDCLECNNKPPPCFSWVSGRSLRKTLKPFIDIWLSGLFFCKNVSHKSKMPGLLSLAIKTLISSILGITCLMFNLKYQVPLMRMQTRQDRRSPAHRLLPVPWFQRPLSTSNWSSWQSLSCKSCEYNVFYVMMSGSWWKHNVVLCCHGKQSSIAVIVVRSAKLCDDVYLCCLSHGSRNHLARNKETREILRDFI